MSDKLLTCTEVQAILRISKSKHYRLIHKEKLPTIRVGSTYRIRNSDLEAFLTNAKKKEDHHMIIDNDRIIKKSLDAISQAKDCRYFRVLPTGELQINNYFKSYVYMAYVRGNWFASFGNKKGSSIEIPEEGLSLFAYGNDSLWIQNDKKEVDISNPVLPLDKNTHVVLFAFSGSTYSVIIADGNKYNTAISTDLKKKPENMMLLVLAFIAMIRQYDEKSADEIEQFWLHKEKVGDAESLNSNHEDQMTFEEDESEMIEQKEKVMIQW